MESTIHQSDGYDLSGFLDSSTPCPPETVTNPKDGTSAPNPNCRMWKRHDRLILHPMLASVSGPVAPLISPATSSNEAWPKLERTYASKSRTRMLGLRETLANTWKESNSVSKYMQTIKWIADDLAFIGHPLNEDELIVYVFNGLEPDFKEINATVRARDSPISF